MRFRVSPVVRGGEFGGGGGAVEEAGCSLGLRLHPAPSTRLFRGRGVVVVAWLYPDRGGPLHLGHGASVIVVSGRREGGVGLGGEAVHAFLGSFVLRRVFLAVDAHRSPIFSVQRQNSNPEVVWKPILRLEN